MGHSLGAHISAYAAKAAQKVGLKKKVAQLTGKYMRKSATSTVSDTLLYCHL